MKYRLKVLASLTAILCTAAALAQTGSPEPEATSKPVAFVYVTNSEGINAFTTSSSGKLTKVPGSPFKSSAESITINHKHLYAVADDYIDGYAIADNGSVTLASEISAEKYYPYSCGDVGHLQSDRNGATVYNQVPNDSCDADTFIQAFKVDEKGELQYEGVTKSSIPPGDALLPLRFAAGNKFAYQTTCGDKAGGGGVQSLTEVFKREGDGLLTHMGYDDVAPKAKDPGFVYCSQLLAASADGNLAYAFLKFDENRGPSELVGTALASYKVSEDGKLSTTSTYANMPTPALTYIGVMSISPSAKLLVVGGLGFQLFHFNGSSPITPYSKLLLPTLPMGLFWWDRNDHLYIVSFNQLYVYTVTPSSIQEAPGSPYAFPGIDDLAVMPLE